MSSGGSRLTNGAPISGRPRLDPANIEVIDDEMVEVLRAKTPAERIAMACEINDRARELLAAGVQVLYPVWSRDEVQTEVARILLHETTESSQLLRLAAAEAERSCKGAAIRAWRSGIRARNSYQPTTSLSSRCS
jgi:hypothetical protein